MQLTLSRDDLIEKYKNLPLNELTLDHFKLEIRRNIIGVGEATIIDQENQHKITLPGESKIYFGKLILGRIRKKFDHYHFHSYMKCPNGQNLEQMNFVKTDDLIHAVTRLLPEGSEKFIKVEE